MTESEYLASADPVAMLRLLSDPFVAAEAGLLKQSARPSERKLRLFAGACRRLGYCVFREGDPHQDAEHMVRCVMDAPNRKHAPAVAALLRDVVGSPFRPAVVLPRDLGVVLARGPRNYRQEDVVSQGWVTPDVLALAEAAYEGRLPDGTLDPARLAVLADALEEAGCLEDSLLMHLRGREPYAECSSCSKKAGTPVLCAACLRNRAAGWMPLRGPHVRGCWAVDLLLGEE
jgi:hypothetical protein